MHKVSAVLIVKNEAHILPRTLKQLSWCDEIVVVDSGSTDGTQELCLAAGCKVFHRDFDGFAKQKQWAVDQASNDWILSIDADEVLSDDLRMELIGLFASDVIPAAGVNLISKTLFMGKLMRFSGLGGQKKLRVFNKTKGKFKSQQVHESIEIFGPIITLKYPMIHYTYDDIADHVEKMNLYTSMASKAVKKKKSGRLMVMIQFPLKFLVSYVLKGGFLDGYPGFMFSFMHSVTATIKYAKFLEQESQKDLPAI